MEQYLAKTTKNFTAIPIKKIAYEKIKEYALLVNGYECYGLLVSPKSSKDAIVHDALLAHNQEASGSHVTVYPEDVALSKEEMENLGYKPIGFWHSHGSLNTFHSGTDDRNMGNLVLSFSGNTEELEIVKQEPHYILTDKQIIFKGHGKEVEVITNESPPKCLDEVLEESSSEYILGMKNDGRLFITRGKGLPAVVVQSPPQSINLKNYSGNILGTTGVAYSIVVNSDSDNFSLIYVSRLCYACKHLHEPSIHQANLEIVDPKSPVRLNKEKIKEEVMERVKFKNKSIMNMLFGAKGLRR